MNIEVKVIAGARKRGISLDGSLLRVKILSKPLKGKANAELIEYIADTFQLKRRDVAIVAGEHDTRKLVSLPLDLDGVRRMLEETSSPSK